MKRKWLRVIYLIIGSISLLGCKKDRSLPSYDKASVEKLIRSEMKNQSLTSVSFCVVKENQVLWSDAYGFANKELKKEASIETRYLIASISKSITAAALLQLYEKGLFDLDEDINKYLPFKVVNPKHPGVSITFRMLLSHTSSLEDRNFMKFDHYCYGYDCPKTLEQLFYEVFTPGEAYFSEKNYVDEVPGEQFVYSNLGYALVGYLVERISKKDFDVYCSENIFKPLSMERTSWRLKDIPRDELAVPYAPLFTPKEPHYTFADYPNGGLRTTANDLARFMKALMMNGSSQGYELLQPSTVSLMQKPSVNINEYSYGLGLMNNPIGNLKLWGHTGGEVGASTMMFFDPETKIGVIVLVNNMYKNLDTILKALIRYGQQD